MYTAELKLQKKLVLIPPPILIASLKSTKITPLEYRDIVNKKVNEIAR